MLSGLLLACGRRHGHRLRIRLIVGERQHTDNERSGQSRHAIKVQKPKPFYRIRWLHGRGHRNDGRDTAVFYLLRKITFMTEFEIITTPAGGHRQADIFAAHWGDILLATSRTPFFDSARKLLG